MRATPASSARWLRIAAGLTLVQALAHTIGAVLVTPTPGSAESSLRDAMRAFRFVVAGVERSYLDAYLGSGWTITAMLLASVVLLWQLARMVVDAPRVARPLIVTLIAAFGGTTAIGSVYFVPPPTVFAAAITLCLCAAVFGVRKA